MHEEDWCRSKCVYYRTDSYSGYSAVMSSLYSLYYRTDSIGYSAVQYSRTQLEGRDVKNVTQQEQEQQQQEEWLGFICGL